MDLLLNILLAIAVFGPPWLLRRKSQKLRWRTRYLLALIPAVYTGLGWQFASLTYKSFGCLGGMKNLHDCFVGEIDITALMGYGFFLMIPFTFVAGPLSLWLLLSTVAEQIGAWHQNTDSSLPKE